MRNHGGRSTLLRESDADGAAPERDHAAKKGDAIRTAKQPATKVQAYVFIDTQNPGPKRIVGLIRKIPGVVRADALLGTPDIVAIVEGDDIATMDVVIDHIAAIQGVLDTESKVIRWV